jgi:opacity protein-like surface antigen
MKKLTIACSLVAASYSTASFADTKNFEGLSAAFNLGFVSAAVNNGIGAPYSQDGLGGKQSFVAGIDLSYGAKMSDTSVITVGVEADLTQPAIFTAMQAGTETILKQKNGFGVSIAPGTVINNDTLLYGKVSYNSMKLEINVDGEHVSSTNFTGFGYGFGIKTMISPTVFVKVEVNRVSFGAEIIDDALNKPSGTTGVLGIGRSF